MSTYNVADRAEIICTDASFFDYKSLNIDKFETHEPALKPSINNMKIKSRIIESFGLKSAESRKGEVGGMARAKGRRFHRRRAKEMIKAIKNGQKEKER